MNANSVSSPVGGMEKPYVVGIDMGGTGTKFGIVNARGEVLFQSQIPTQSYPDIHEYCDVLATELRRLAQNVGGFDSIRGIGAGTPNGNYYTGNIEQAANLPWKGTVPFAKMLTERTGLPCRITNDANAAAMGEMTYGVARGMRNFIEITLGTGVGSGIVVDGKILYGHDGFAGELGHTKAVPTPEGRQCGCGQRGCLETYTSATGVARTARDIIEHSSQTTLLREVDPEKITSFDVFKAAEAGDSVAKEIFDFTGRMLGRKLADFIAFSAPEAIVLFGGLTKAGHWILDPVVESMNENTLPVWRGKVKVLVSTLKDSDAAILGASSLAWDFAAQAPMG